MQLQYVYMENLKSQRRSSDTGVNKSTTLSSPPVFPCLVQDTRASAMAEYILYYTSSNCTHPLQCWVRHQHQKADFLMSVQV